MAGRAGETVCFFCSRRGLSLDFDCVVFLTNQPIRTHRIYFYILYVNRQLSNNTIIKKTSKMADNLKYLRCLCECPFKKNSPEEEELAYRSKKIDQMIKQDQRKMQQEVKLLLLRMNNEYFVMHSWV